MKTLIEEKSVDANLMSMLSIRKVGGVQDSVSMFLSSRAEVYGAINLISPSYEDKPVIHNLLTVSRNLLHIQWSASISIK